jgi:hypothetical protein
VDSQQFAFAREAEGECVIVAVNAADKPANLHLKSLPRRGGVLIDLLTPVDQYRPLEGCCSIDLQPYSARILNAQSV